MLPPSKYISVKREPLESHSHFMTPGNVRWRIACSRFQGGNIQSTYSLPIRDQNVITGLEQRQHLFASVVMVSNLCLQPGTFTGKSWNWGQYCAKEFLEQTSRFRNNGSEKHDFRSCIWSTAGGFASHRFCTKVPPSLPVVRLAGPSLKCPQLVVLTV